MSRRVSSVNDQLLIVLTCTYVCTHVRERECRNGAVVIAGPVFGRRAAWHKAGAPATLGAFSAWHDPRPPAHLSYHSPGKSRDAEVLQSP